jgi:hypothetical protein
MPAKLPIYRKQAVAFGNDFGSFSDGVKEKSLLMKCCWYGAVRAAAFSLLACPAGILISPGPVAAAVKVREIIRAEEAQKRVGQTCTVCGIVASTRYAETTPNKMTYLNLGRPYPDQVFTAAIPGPLRALYSFRPEEYYKGKNICVAGQVTLSHDKPQIVIDDPFQIRIDQPVRPIINTPPVSTNQTTDTTNQTIDSTGPVPDSTNQTTDSTSE